MRSNLRFRRTGIGPIRLCIGWIAVTALATAGLVHAQDPRTAGCSLIEARFIPTLLDVKGLSNSPTANGRSGAEEARCAEDGPPRWDVQLGLAGWDHSLEGAFELGARLMQLAGRRAWPGAAVSPLPGRSSVLRLSAYGSPPKASLDAIAKALRIDQLERQGMNLHMSSPLGNFRLQYREVFTGRANSMGGGVGQAAAAASWTTPRFGTGGLFDFTAAALMGTGSINQLLGNGFGSSVIGGNGPALRKNPGPTVAIKLTF